jgi:hypothetical protein
MTILTTRDSGVRQPAAESGKQAYVCPTLRFLGDIRELTLGGSRGNVDSIDINTLQN